MNYTLPYYGKKGTIKSIEETDKNYEVNRYGMNKNDTYQLKVKKNKINEELLVENYYNDLKNYLTEQKDKYDKYNKDNKNKVNQTKLNVLKLTGIILIGSSIPLLQTYGTPGYIGVALDIISIPIVIEILKLTIKEKKQNNRTKFINKYDELKHRLRIYNENNSKSLELTKYSSLISNNKEPKRDINKKLERKKVA